MVRAVASGGGPESGPDRTRDPWTRRVVLVLVIVALAVLSGCGGSDDAPGADDSPPNDDDNATTAARRLTRAARTTLALSSMRFDVRLSFDGPGPAQLSRVEGHGDFDSGDGEVSASSDRLEVRAVIRDEQFWVTSDERDFLDEMPNDKRWVHGTFDEMLDSDAISPLQVPALLYLLLGTERVRADDRDDSRYTFGLDLTRAKARAPSARREEVGDLLSATGGKLRPSGEATVDDEGRVTDLVAQGVFVGETTPSPRFNIRWDARFDDLGEAVDVVEPDRDETVALADVPGLRDWLFGAEDSSASSDPGHTT